LDQKKRARAARRRFGALKNQSRRFCKEKQKAGENVAAARARPPVSKGHI